MDREIAIQIHSVELPDFVDRHCMSTEELGQLVLDISAAARAGNLAFIKELPFVRGVRSTRIGGRRRFYRYISPQIRADVLSAGRCSTCGSTDHLAVDHIKPLAHGGTSDRANLQCLCRGCNSRKGHRWTG